MNAQRTIVDKITTKSSMKLQVFENLQHTFHTMKRTAQEIALETDRKVSKVNKKLVVEFRDKGEFEGELRFAGDILIFTMHTNVFEFPRLHEVMKTAYVTEDLTRSYCGVIHVYNFLADSFRYNRMNDLGYLVARIFINKDRHFIVEGKRQIGYSFSQFSKEPINKFDLRNIIESAMLYSIDFDLLTPPYDLVKEVSVLEIQENSYNMKIKTGKRLGFRFQADHDKIS